MKKKIIACSRVSLFPPEHGGAKNLRSIMENLAKTGAECLVLVKIKSSGFRFAGQDLKSLKDFDINGLRWRHQGVTYQGILGSNLHLAKALETELASSHIDRVLLYDDALDEDFELFQAAARSDGFVFLGQTIHSLPFGPYAMHRSERVSAVIAKARQIVAPSRHVQSYFETHLQRSPAIYHPNVFGEGPFPRLGRLENPYITMINPCAWKGSSIFCRLARHRPDLRFAAVPTWGATPAIMQELAELPNVTILPETPQIDEIFAQTRILLTPSLCQEAFGLVAPEALLRGVPVISSDIAGLKESTLGAATLIPVQPLPFDKPPKGDNPSNFVWDEPDNPIEPWSDAIDAILQSPATYSELSTHGKKIAEDFVRRVIDQPLDMIT